MLTSDCFERWPERHRITRVLTSSLLSAPRVAYVPDVDAVFVIEHVAGRGHFWRLVRCESPRSHTSLSVQGEA